MTDDAEISPLVENRGQHLKLLFGRKERGSPAPLFGQALIHTLTWRGRRGERGSGVGKHIS